MKIRHTFALLLLLTAGISFAQQKSSFAPQLDAILETFQKQDLSILQKVTHENYTIKGIFPGMEEQILPQVFAQLPSFTNYTIEGETAEPNGTRIALYFSDEEKAFKYPANFLIDKNVKISEFNILENAEISTQVNKK